MSKILLIEPNPHFRDLLSVNLNMFTGVDIIGRQSLQEGLEVLKVIPEMDLVVIRDRFAKENYANELYRFLQSYPRELPIVVMGEEHQLKSHVKTVKGEGQELVKEVVGSCAKILGITAKVMVNKVVPDYYPIDLRYFYHLDSSPCDVYVRIHKGEGDYQYVKRIHTSENVDREALDNYGKKGVREFYVESQFRLSFTKNLAAKIIARFDDTKASMDQRMNALASGQDLVAEDLRAMGVTEEVVALANSAIQSMSKVAASMPSLKNLISELLKSKASFRFRHSQVLTYLTFHMVNKMEWGSKEQADKLSFVSFFHDICLVSDEEAQVHGLEDLKSLQARADVADRINKHAYNAAELVKSYPSIPLGADTLIKQHHGTKNGVGFTDVPSPQISPLAIVFIVAEDLAQRILKSSEGPFDLAQALAAMEKKFAYPKYRKVLEILGPALGMPTNPK